VLFEGTPEEVKMHKQVQKQYLGDIEGDLPESAKSLPQEAPVKAPHWLKRPTTQSSAAPNSSTKTTLRRRTDV
jgi:hypothetical protein